MHSPRMRRRLTTAQNTPAGWFGTVVSLHIFISTSLYVVTKRNSLNIITIDHIVVQRASRLSMHKVIHTLNVIYDHLDVGREDEDEGKEGECADGVESDEDDAALSEDHFDELDIKLLNGVK